MQKIEPTKYYTSQQWECIKKESDSHPTPNLVIDLAIIQKNFLDLKENFPFAKVYYAVKSNPNVEAMKLLSSLGANFDCASIYEFDLVLANGGEASRISFGNTIKKREDIKYVYDKGCRLFATDCKKDLKNIAELAPGSDVFFRVLVDGSGSAEWPLSIKFGAEAEIIEELVPLSKKLGLNPRGMSFHVGSQQNDVDAWGPALKKVSDIFKKMSKEHQIELDLINLGGGLPAKYLKKNQSIQEYAAKIKSYLNEYFSPLPANIIMEPGRSLFGNSGVLKSSVVLISKKEKRAKDKWLYIDAGIYNGLSEAANEVIHFPIYSEASGELTKKFIIAGPTCDSADIMYRKFRNPLPENIKIGDSIYWLSIGAYCNSCCSVGFNGFPPLTTYVVNSNEIGNNINS